MDEKNLFDRGIEKAKKSDIIFENLLIIMLLVVGFIGMFSLTFFNIPVISIIYIAFSLYMHIFPIRKHLCTNCYYYDKLCHCGWGKLSSLLHKKNSGNQKLGSMLALITWIIIMFFPVIVMTAMFFIKIGNLNYQLIIFISFVLLVLTNIVIHKFNCDNCKMKYICPGSPSYKKVYSNE